MFFRKRDLAAILLVGLAFLAFSVSRSRSWETGRGLLPSVRAVSALTLQAAASKLPDQITRLFFEQQSWLSPGQPGPVGMMASDLPFQMIFPHAPAGVGGGFSIQSSVFILNNSGANARGTIFFYLQNGSAMTVQTTLGTAASFDFELLPGEELRVETQEPNATRTGWIEVRSNVQLAGSGTFTVFEGANFISEVGIGDSPVSSNTLLFVDTREGKDTGFAISNPSPDQVLDYRVQVRRLDGTVLASQDGSLAPHGQTAQFVTDIDPSLKNLQGILVITSETGSFALITLRTRGLFFTSFPVAPRVEDVSDDGTLLFSRLADGRSGDLRIFSTFQLMNNSDTEAMATLHFFGEDGEPLPLEVNGETVSEVAVVVAANSAVELISQGTGPAKVGWARVETSIPLAGSAAFTIVDAMTNDFVSEVGIPDRPESNRFILYAEVGGGIDTGVALTNTGETTIQVRLRLVGSRPSQSAAPTGLESTIEAMSAIELEPGTHLARFVSQFFSSVMAVAEGDFRGRLEMVAIQEDLSRVVGFDFEVPMGGLTLRTRGPLLTSLPAAPYVRNFEPTLALDLATTITGSSPRTCLGWRQQDSERGIRMATVSLDRGRIDFSRLTEDTQFAGELNASVLLFNVANFAKLLVTEVDGEQAVFYGPLSVSPTGEASPYSGTIRNLPGDGFAVTLLAGPPETEPAILPIPGLVQVCLDSGLVQLPDDPGPVLVTEQYQSMAMGEGMLNPLMRSVTSRFEVVAPLEGVQITGVTTARVLGGGIVEILGTGFSSDPLSNQVTVETNSRTEAEVLEASANRLVVQLPNGIQRGPIRVETGGQISNDYQLAVAFAPVGTVELPNPGSGQRTAFSVSFRQSAGEIQFEELAFDPGNGDWVTVGLPVDLMVGQMTLRQLVDEPVIPEDVQSFDIKVISSSSDALQLGAFESGDDEAQFLIEFSAAGSLRFQPAELDFTFLLLGDLVLELDFQEALLTLPGSNSWTPEFTFLSQAERLGRPGTRQRVVQPTQVTLN